MAVGVVDKTKGEFRRGRGERGAPSHRPLKCMCVLSNYQFAEVRDVGEVCCVGGNKDVLRIQKSALGFVCTLLRVASRHSHTVPGVTSYTYTNINTNRESVCVCERERERARARARERFAAAKVRVCSLLIAICFDVIVYPKLPATAADPRSTIALRGVTIPPRRRTGPTGTCTKFSAKFDAAPSDTDPEIANSEAKAVAVGYLSLPTQRQFVGGIFADPNRLFRNVRHIDGVVGKAVGV